MVNIETLLIKTEQYCDDACFELKKIAFIQKLPSGEYRVVSKKGRNFGTYHSKEDAQKRLKQIEFFKFRNRFHFRKKKASSNIIDLTNITDFSFSSIMRELNKKADKDQVHSFLRIFKDIFDKAVANKTAEPSKYTLSKTLIEFNKLNKIKINSDMVKSANLKELGDAKRVGKYLADIIRFTLTRISPESRPSAIEKVKHKIYALNDTEIASKELPASASMGQSITFVKHVLFDHDPVYVREVINNIVSNL